jgi:predicted SnoaL-like aldol condensation-catalyzing enzyme
VFCKSSTDASTKGQQVEKRLVTRYATKSQEAADENQRRIEGVFSELAATKPDNVSYIVLRLADDSFVHVSFHNHGEDETNPISSTAAFSHIQDGHESRREGPVIQQTATLVGSYITEIA